MKTPASSARKRWTSSTAKRGHANFTRPAINAPRTTDEETSR
jgi:hypothetical protein